MLLAEGQTHKMQAGVQASCPLAGLAPAGRVLTVSCTGALPGCRMEYVLHPDPHGPHPVDGWPGNPWIYQVGNFAALQCSLQLCYRMLCYVLDGGPGNPWPAV